MYDLIIVGGGPSGSAAGRLAGKMGLETLLIEKETFPRYKACGGGLSEHAMSYLDHEIPDNIQERDIYGAKLYYKDMMIEGYKDHRLSILVTRSVLDNYLLDMARDVGIEVHTNEKVTDLTELNDHVEVHTDNTIYRSKFVIIAEGSQGTLKNKVRRKDRKDEYGVCMVTEVKENNETIEERLHNAIELHFGGIGQGYGWIFPHRGYYSVGVGGIVKYAHNPKTIMLDLLKSNGFQGDYKLHGHTIPSGGVKRDLVGSRIVLCGDSAGFVDTFTGEGMTYAIRSGQIAVEVIHGILSSDQHSGSLSRYSSRCQSEFGEHLRYSRLFTKIMYTYPDVTFRIFTGQKEIFDKFLDVVAFKITYKDFLKWLLFNFRFRWLKG